jgi:hypothetical protein
MFLRQLGSTTSFEPALYSPNLNPTTFSIRKMKRLFLQIKIL